MSYKWFSTKNPTKAERAYMKKGNRPMKPALMCVIISSLWIPCVTQAKDIPLWPQIEPYHSDFLRVSDIHRQ